MAKSDPQGGTRTAGRHMGELGVGGALALFIISFIPQGEAGVINAFQANLGSIILTGFFSTVSKKLHEKGFLPDIGKVGIVVLLAGSIGCAGQVGLVRPTIHTGADGATVVACEVRGISFAFGDADICRNIEGGTVSQFFADMFLGTVRLVSAGVAGFFSGLGGAGAGMQAAIAATPDTVSESVATQPAIVIEPTSGSSSTADSPVVGEVW